MRTSQHGSRGGDALLQLTRHLQCFASVHDQVANLFMHCRYHADLKKNQMLCTHAFAASGNVTVCSNVESPRGIHQWSHLLHLWRYTGQQVDNALFHPRQAACKRAIPWGYRGHGDRGQ